MKEDPMPDGLDYPEQILYQSLSLLYGRYHKQLVSRDDAKKEKTLLLDEYEAYKRNWNMGQEWCEIIKLTELARAEFRKNPTVENGWKIINIIEGRKT
jgi:hypothetical protein